MLLFGLLTLIGCVDKTDKIKQIGVNAEIIEINSQQKTILVKGLDENSILGDKCYVNCTNADYVEVIDEEPTKITFDDLNVGDKITVDVTAVLESYPTQTSTDHVQLLERANG